MFMVESSQYVHLKNGYGIIYSPPTEFLIETLSCLITCPMSCGAQMTELGYEPNFFNFRLSLLLILS